MCFVQVLARLAPHLVAWVAAARRLADPPAPPQEAGQGRKAQLQLGPKRVVKLVPMPRRAAKPPRTAAITAALLPPPPPHPLPLKLGTRRGRTRSPANLDRPS